MRNLYTPKQTGMPYGRKTGKIRTEEELKNLAAELAGESIVLLQNDRNLLPLEKNCCAAFFGRSQIDTLIGGSGSGASHSREKPAHILEECRLAGIRPVPELASFYEELLSSEVIEDPFARLTTGGADLINSGIIYEIFGRYIPPRVEYAVPPALVSSAAGKTDTAILILGRASGGEECDRHVLEDYELTALEKQLLNQVCTAFSHVVLILNSNGMIDTGWIASYPSIQAVLFLGLPGERGARALAQILTGELTPSGKLCSTFACSYEDYPSAAHFSWDKEHTDSIKTYEDYGLSPGVNNSHHFAKSPVTVYLEDLYMGYRYFDSFGKRVVFPFGFGLSYCDFTLTDTGIRKEGSDLIVTLTVTNTSLRYSGKEVVQVYTSAPWDRSISSSPAAPGSRTGTGNADAGNPKDAAARLEKPYQELKAFEKTELLAPGERQRLSIAIPLRELASYEEATASYVLEPGSYYVRVGTGSRNTHIAGSFSVPSKILCARYENRLTLRDCNRERLTFLSAASATPISYPGEKEEKEKEPVFCVSQDDIVPNLSRSDEAEPLSVSYSDADLLSQLSIPELAVLVNGYGPGLPFGGLGSKAAPTISDEKGEPLAVCTHPNGSMGYVSPGMPRYRIPSIYYKDGPASVGRTAWPTGMLLACSFNLPLLYAFGSACGYEAAAQNVDSWLAPGLNLHRNPIGGRNFEYFSEDPVLAGACGVSICRGAEEENHITACPKHFAVNEQETYRRGSSRLSFDAVDSILTERAARELYLKPFEMVVKGSNVHTLMTSFNKINGCFAGGSYDLCTCILREEWGYEGIVVTDWGDMDIAVDGADAVAAGNDIIMPGGPPVIAQVLKGYEEGRVTRSQLMLAASRLLKTVEKSASYEKQYPSR